MIKVFFVCSGLGRIHRGLESFTRQAFDALKEQPGSQIILFKGAGRSSANEKALWNLPRRTRTARRIGALIKRNTHFVEQITFSLSLLWHIRKEKPEVIFFSDGNIGNFLWHWRRLAGGNYKLLFSNGGPLSPPFPRWDKVQQVAPSHVQHALKMGESAEKQIVVPYGIALSKHYSAPAASEIHALRQQLGLPDRPIIISVGAIGMAHKRMDYLIKEVAALKQPRPFLLMLGQQDSHESPQVIQLARELLRPEDYQIKTVPASAVDSYYRAADVFVLASLHEGFGRVFLEAAGHGLPCLAHDYDLTRYILAEQGYFADFNQEGALTALLSRVLNEKSANETHNEMHSEAREARHRDIYQRFSWDVLASDYMDMLKKTARSDAAPATNPRAPGQTSDGVARARAKVKNVVAAALPRVSRSLAQRYGNTGARERIARAIQPVSQGKIIAGPFRGMPYIDTAAGSALTPKIIGSYEQELIPVIEEVIERARKGAYSMIVDIGSAEGYYAVGLAFRCPTAQITVFEGDERARQLCLQLATKNGVSERIQIKGYCDVAALQKDLQPDAFVLCDCEGSEVDLLDPVTVPALLSAELLVELHDFCRPDATRIITQRFAPTHEIRIIDTAPRVAGSHPSLKSLKEQDQLIAMKEHRPGPMQWAWLKPRAQKKEAADVVSKN